MNTTVPPRYYTWINEIQYAELQRRQPPSQPRENNKIQQFLDLINNWLSTGIPKKMIMVFSNQSGPDLYVVFDYSLICMERFNLILNMQPTKQDAWRMIITVKELSNHSVVSTVELLEKLTPYSRRDGGLDRMISVVKIAYKLGQLRYLASNHDDYVKQAMIYVEPLYAFTDYQLTHIMDVYKSLLREFKGLLSIEEDLNEIHRRMLANDHLPERIKLICQFTEPNDGGPLSSRGPSAPMWFILSETTKYDDLEFLYNKLLPFLPADMPMSRLEFCFVLFSRCITNRGLIQELFEKAHQARDNDPFNFDLYSFIIEATKAKSSTQ